MDLGGSKQAANTFSMFRGKSGGGGGLPPPIPMSPRNAHVCGSVGLDRLVVEVGTLAGTPFEAAEHAGLRSAAIGHVVTSFLKLDERSAAVTTLPSCFPCSLEKCSGLRVITTVPGTMPICVTSLTNLCLTFPAYTLIFTPTLLISSGLIHSSNFFTCNKSYSSSYILQIFDSAFSFTDPGRACLLHEEGWGRRYGI